MLRIKLFLLMTFLLLVKATTAVELTARETVSITGYWAEVFVKEGEVLTSQCEMGEKTWWFCNILVKVTKSASSPEQWQGGIWTCTYGLWPKFHKNGYGWFNPLKIRYQCIAGQKGV